MLNNKIKTAISFMLALLMMVPTLVVFAENELDWETYYDIREYSWSYKNKLNAIAYHDGTYVAVGDNGLIITSTNGTEWSAQKVETDCKRFRGVVYGASRFVVVGGGYYGGDEKKYSKSEILISEDGIKWKAVETEETEKYRFVSVAYNGKVFVIVDDTNYALVSPDGFNWQGYKYSDSTYSSSYKDRTTEIISDGNVFLIKKYRDLFSVYNINNLFFSNDGTNWKSINPYENMNYSYNSYPGYEEITYYNGKFVIWSSNPDYLLTSISGEDWIAEKINDPLIKYSHETNYRHVTTDGNQLFLNLLDAPYKSYVSNDGINWTVAPYEAEGALLYVNGLYILQSNKGTLTSNNGIDWTPINITNAPIYENLNSGIEIEAEYYSPKLMNESEYNHSDGVVATDGNVYFSIKRIPYSGGGDAGAPSQYCTDIYFSTDGSFNYSLYSDSRINIKNWKELGLYYGPEGAGSKYNDSKIFYGRGLFLVTSKEKIYYFDTTNMSLAQANCPEGYYINSIIYDGERFIAAGKGMLYSYNGIDWTADENFPKDKVINKLYWNRDYYVGVGDDVVVGAQRSIVRVEVNGQELTFDTPPRMISDRTFVPIRALFEEMGAEVNWDEETNTATVTQNDQTITFQMDNTAATVNGEVKEMDVPARMINDRIMIPLRFLSENLGYQVDWDDENYLVSITY